ncbi:MAG: phosphate/phosphite/phosphonate ABC transporter substrate-binding protein [Chloroflexota bacterium]
MNRRRYASSVAAVAVLAAAVAAPAFAQSPSAATGRIPDKLILGLVPSADANVLITNAQPLADYLTQAVGIPTESLVPTDYTALVVAMGNGGADIGAFGPFALVQAADESGADIVLQSVRNGAITYHTQWMTNDPATFCSTDVVTTVAPSREDTPRDVTLGFCNGADTATKGPLAEDAIAKIPAGSTISFVDQTSASGFIYPYVQLMNAGIGDPSLTPEGGTPPTTEITAMFAGGHDASVAAVCKGDALAGVSFNDARLVPAAVQACGTDQSGNVVFALSPEIPNDGVALAGDLDPALKQKITDALLAYGQTEEGKAVLTSIYQISEFAPADLSSLDVVREAAAKLGL